MRLIVFFRHKSITPPGCKSYQLSEETCDTDPVEPYNGAVSCTSNEDAFHNFDELTLHTT